MFIIDDWLLRRVFQPIVDWMSPWCGRFRMARSCIYIGVALLLPAPLEYLRKEGWLMGGVIILANMTLAFIWLRRAKIWHLYERAEAVGLVLRPNLTEAITRIFTLLIYVPIEAIYFMPPILLGNVFEAAAFTLFVASSYFAGCNQGTPRQRRVMQWAPSPA